jgi:hypothetical protein
VASIAIAASAAETVVDSTKIINLHLNEYLNPNSNLLLGFFLWIGFLGLRNNACTTARDF